MEIPKWLVALYVGIQILIPTVLFLVRWLVFQGDVCFPAGWQMYACH